MGQFVHRFRAVFAKPAPAERQLLESLLTRDQGRILRQNLKAILYSKESLASTGGSGPLGPDRNGRSARS